MSAPRLEVDLLAVTHNTRTLVDRLAPRGIRVTGVTKAALGAPDLAAAMLAGGALGLGDSRVENLARLRAAGPAVPADVPRTLIRSPMVSQADDAVRVATTSLVTEARTLDALSAAAARQGTRHDVVLMVELGDLREGVPAADLVDLARSVRRHAGLRLAGVGTNLACQSGVVPGPRAMRELSDLAAQVEVACGRRLEVVSGGNSASLAWALGTDDVGRVDELRLGESLLLGTDPLTRAPIEGLRTDAFTLVAEVIEVQAKPAQPWGEIGQAAYGDAPARRGTGTVRQALVAVGRQDVEPEGLVPPAGVVVLGASSDHLVLDVGDVPVEVGDELRFGLGYGGLVRAGTSPFVAWTAVALDARS
ncbi:alanine/ornithine racemase family PLP-dependent enzyme [Luteimicrobium sp. DT211]|uniref:alanine/ornithine racemase family PLP-dependent enzyme n=1 Tax=Luteimicrobium sp. DT211 TaxID=3393412 RepID=UPI003CF3EF91